MRKTANKRFMQQGKQDFCANFRVERDSEISKNNALLIRNLLEISHGKRVSLFDDLIVGNCIIVCEEG